jgi:tetratricopeptide (TPR) repeat protein
MNYYYFIQELAFKRQDSVEMERAFNELLKWNYSRQLYSFHAQNYFKVTQNPLAALKIVDDGLTKYPSDSSMLFEKSFLEGISHYNNNEFAEAIKFFMDDLKYKDDVPSIQNIVYSYFNLGMYQEALLFSNLIVGKIDTKGRLEFIRGICYQKTGRKKEACSELIKAKSLGYQVDSALLTGCK